MTTEEDRDPDSAPEELPSEAIVPVEGEIVEAGVRGDLAPDLRMLLVTAALLSGLCQFVPIPFLDDFLTRKVRKHQLTKLLEAYGRGYSPRRLGPLYKETEGCLATALGWVLALPVRLVLKLLKKVFKTILIVLTLRDAALNIAWTLLMGRTLQRLLEGDELGERGSAGPEDPLWAEALRIRHEFDAAFKGSDLRMLQHAFMSVISGVKGLPRLGAYAVRSMFRRLGKSESPGEMPERSRPAVSAGVDRLLDTLGQEEIAKFMKEFDWRFDEIHRPTAAPQLEAGPDASA
ncbi:MAG: hypothetical protein ABIK09_06480 [Pseudomonadota bacterium]